MEANEQLAEKDTEEENPDDVLEALLCNKKLFSELYPHQRDGILFLYNAYKNGKSKGEGSRNGVILADEMGLGKSIQVILFLHFMIMNTHKWKNALLVMPAGLLRDWKGKLENWTPDMTVLIYQNSEKELLRKLRRLQKTGGILLVSYDMFIKHHQTHTTYKGMPFIWDCLVFDEAHRLKNTATKNHKVAASISAGFHILMTGTPIQNNLKEYWSLVSLISDTCLLGTYRTFKTNFENPITKGMAADSGPEERALGIELQKALEKITEPILLRRRKDQIQDPSDHTPSEAGLCLPKKHEYVVWIKLSPEQEVAYRNIVDKSPVLTFQSIHYLIPVCTHPRFNTMAQKARDVHLAESGKLAFMLALLEMLTANGSFVLVFSNYIKILEIIQKALTQTPWGRNAFLRIDGQNPTQRDKIVNRFQKKRRENILLLTTSVGAEGLTLTAADSVVFADLSWNQSVDAQAVGRAHRIGQTKEVVTYRLITCGTLEETMYRKQLFKGSLTRQSMGDEQNPLRHFTQNELKTCLPLQQTQFSYTQKQLEKQGAKILNITEIFGGLSSLGAASVCGISDHGQLLSASQGEDLAVDMARMQITETAKMCKQEIEAESHLTRQQTGEDLSVRKCVKKDKIRRKTQKARTPGLPQKYKCFKTPFSATRRKNLHISRPCVFESSDDSSHLSADEDISFCEKSSPHISFSVKSEATSDLVDKHNTYTCNSTCSKGNSGLNKSTNSKHTVVCEYISKESTELDPDGSHVTHLNMDLPNVADEDKSGSPATDLEQDVSSVAVPVNLSVYSGNSESELDSLKNALDSDISDSQSHKLSASCTMNEHSFSTSPEDSHVEKSGSSHLPEANTSENFATDTSMPSISLMHPHKTIEFTDLKEEANFKDPGIQNETVCTKTAVNLNSDSYQGPPHISPFTPSASPCTAQKMILNQESSASSTMDEHFFSTSPEDTEKSGSSHLPEANTSENIATDKSMPDISLMQPNETDDITDLKEEANSPGSYQDPPYTSLATPSASPCTAQKMILYQESLASCTMNEHSFSTSPEETEKSGSSHLPEANTSRNIATDKSMPDIRLMPPNEIDDITDLKEEANSPRANFKAPKIKTIPVISEQNEMTFDKTALNLNSDSYQDPPHISPFTPSASPCTAQKMILNQESSASSTMNEHSFSTSPEDTEKSGSSHLPEANTSENIATDKSMPDISLVQPNEIDDIADLKEEANSPGGNFKDPEIKTIPVISKQNEMTFDKTALNLNSDSYQDPSYTSPATPSAFPCTAQKDMKVDMAEICIEETTTINLQEIGDESYFSKQMCINVATRKPDRKAKFRRWSYETTTDIQPRKYKCYTSPISSTRRKTMHTSRPCVFDSSDGYRFKAHEEKITERTIQNMSVTDLKMYVHPEHISTPDNSESVLESLYNTSDTNDSDTSDSHSYKSSAFSTMDEHSISTSHEDSNIEKSGSSPQYHKYVSANVSYVSDEDNYMNKYDKGCLQEANISVTSRYMTDTSLGQSSETDKLTDLKEEANSQTVKCPAQQELKIQVNDEFEERVPLLPLNLNTLFSDNSLHTTTFETSHEFQKKELQLLDSSCEDFKTDLKSNQVVPVLCDYSLTPSCISVCITPSAGHIKHNNEPKQLEECDGFCVFKEEENCQDVSATFLDLSAHSSENCQQLNLPQIQGSQLVRSSSKKEVNIKDHKVADICYKDSSKSGLKFTQPALKLCDYTLTPGCISLVDSPSVEKRKHAPSGNYQSSPLKSGQVVHQESPDHLKRRLSFSHVNSRTPVKSSPKGKLCESSQLKRSKKRTPGLPRKYKCFSPSLVKTARKTKLIFQENDSDSNFSQVRKTAMDKNEVQIINSEKQMEQCKINMKRTAIEKDFNAKENSHFTVSNRKRSTRTKLNDSTFSTTTPEWKNGKENLERLIPTMCGYSLNQSAFSQSTPQGVTQIQPVKRQLLTREDTEDQLCPMNRAVDTNQPENHMSRAKTVVSEMFSPENASIIIKAFRHLLFPKRKHRRTRRDYSFNSRRPNFSMTYRRHKNKLLKSIKNVHKNPNIVDKSDAHVSFIPKKYIHGLVANKSASASSSVSCPKLTKETSPIQKVQGSIHYQCIMPLNEIPEGESVQSTNLANGEVESVHGLFTEGSLETPVLKGTSTSFTQLNQVIQNSNTDHYPRVQECSTAKTLKRASREDNEGHELQNASQDEIFVLSPISSAPDSVTSNGQAQVVKSFTSGHKPMWEMSFSPEIQYTPRKESNIPKGTNQANSNPHKWKTETFSDDESGQLLAFESYMDCCFITEKNDDSDDSVKEASDPVATLVTYNAQSPPERIITAERDARGGIRAFRDFRQLCDQTNKASEISENQPQAQEKGDYAELSECHKPLLEEEQKIMFRYTPNDAKSEKASDLQTPVEEIFCLLHKLKRL